MRFRSVRWLDMSACITTKCCETYSVRKKVIFYQTPDMKKREELKTRNNRLISKSKHPLLEQLLRLLRVTIINAVQ